LTLIRPFPSVHKATAVAVFYAGKKYKKVINKSVSERLVTKQILAVYYTL
jgi:hypothetical protein